MSTPARATALITATLLAATTLALPTTAEAFCGFYVSGADAKMFNDATQVVMMREGTRTVLSMQNTYKGPPEDFAMVIPVPVVLDEDKVKTLAPALFDKVDKMASPRLVEYWERDPCYEPPDVHYSFDQESGGVDEDEDEGGADNGVRVEAEFKVAEYDVVILSADDSTGLDRWLRGNDYNIPKGAEGVLDPYVKGGMYFFVAKVDAQKVKFDAQGQATLSPLRFHYDAKDFSLPIRLGLLNAKGDQDLIVHILARQQRYQVSNYENVTIPTNFDVADEVRTRFPEFYAALFDRTLAQNKGSVVTEYAWDASTCDPCPGPTLTPEDFAGLGADVLPGAPRAGFVLTRLHARYNKDNLGEDLVFEAAPPIVGGREVNNANGELEHGSKEGSVNNFQGRYAIRHPWEGPILCLDPKRGVWGGPPGGGGRGLTAAQNTAFAPRGDLELADVVRRDLPEIGVTAKLSPIALDSGGCGGCGCRVANDPRPTGTGLALIFGVCVMALAARRRRARQEI